MAKHWKIVFYLSALFLAGFGTGAAVTVKLTRQALMKRNNMEHVMGVVARTYRRELQLTAEQEELLQPVFREAGIQLQAVKFRAVDDVLKVFNQTNARIVQELSPEQRVRFEVMEEKFRNRLTAAAQSPRP